MAKAVIPIYVEIDIPYIAIDDTSGWDMDAAIATVVNYISSLKNSDELNIDSLIKEVHKYYGNYIILQTPLVLKGTVYYPDGTTQVIYSENILTVPEYKTLGVTNRVCGYFTSSKYITFSER